MGNVFDDFLAHTKKEAPKLAGSLAKLSKSAKDALAELLPRFDREQKGSLGEHERALARRFLVLLNRPSGKGLKVLGNVLDYLDINQDKIMAAEEVRLAVDILESFSRADSANNALSTKEIEIIEAVMKSLDTEGKGVLDQNARTRLRESLWDPDGFLAEQREKNPLLKKLLK